MSQPKSNPSDPLHYETHGIVGEGRWFRLYECKHITLDQFPLCTCVNLGPNENLLLCRHCWQQIKGMAVEALLHEQVHHLPSGNRQAFLEALLAGQEAQKAGHSDVE